MQPDITAQTYEEMRIKKRFDVKLKALGNVVGHEGEKGQFIISNLSASGARLHCEKTLDVKTSMIRKVNRETGEFP